MRAIPLQKCIFNLEAYKVEMKIIYGYCSVFQMVHVIIDIGIQTLMMMWISYIQQKSVAIWHTCVFS